MSELDQQLAELALISKAELTPGVRKTGPAVPPKPGKKASPQVPQSFPIKQSVVPSYSSSLLHTNDPRPKTGSTMPVYSTSNAPLYSNLLPSVLNSVPKAFVKSNYAPTYSNIRRPQMSNPVYSNVNPVPGDEDACLPLPSPPPVSCSLTMSGTNVDFLPPPLPEDSDDLIPPPSPVSSSYSELQRATGPQDYGSSFQHSQFGGGDMDSLYGYGDISQSSSTYESIYEPINPRPPSQLSLRSNYSLYNPYVGSNGPMNTVGGTVGTEQQVDNLTDMLVKGMSSSNNSGSSYSHRHITSFLGSEHPRGTVSNSAARNGQTDEYDDDIYGVCAKCGDKIVGENSGCTAMDQLYHTKCFTCYQCAANLQGKPFYALEGQPYCEDDYLNTLEKCCVCHKPILDRILRATGKPYHPKCFSCVVCGKSLDGIPFTVDATNRVHCIDDFHKMFAPRCWVCKQPIMPEPGQDETVRVVALDHSFHTQCYKCEDCGLVLSSDGEGRGCYPLDGHVLCKNCNAKRVQVLTNHMITEL